MVGQLVERIRKKDQQAMSQLYQMYVKELSSVCYRYVPDEDDAKDVLQNSFIKIFTSVTAIKYQNEKAFKGWMMKIVANEALSFLKNRKKVLFVEQDIGQEEEEQQEDPDLEQISSDELHRLISELPAGYRMVVNLYVFEGYSHKLIAELLNISEHTSASQFYYAKKLLARKIKELTKDWR
jgi:RNA polymerase sigma-70 factor (ECF subfamily)